MKSLSSSLVVDWTLFSCHMELVNNFSILNQDNAVKLDKSQQSSTCTTGVANG